jgi:hypothetical protein
MGKVALLSNIHGRFGEVVINSQNGENYIKFYTKPKDRKLPKQLWVRSIFKKVSRIASALSRDVLKPYTFPKLNTHPAYSHMIGLNKLMFTNNEWNSADLKIFEGPLENPGIYSAVLKGDAVTVTFDTAGGKGDDVAIAIVYDETSEGVFKTIGTRSSGTIAVSLPQMANRNVAGFHAYLAFSRVPALNSAGKGLVSITAYKKIV